MLVNPISFRLSVSIFWNSTWSLYNKGNYKYLFYSDLVFFEFFMFFFRKTFITKGLDYYVSHIRLYRGFNKFLINVFYHTSKAEIFFNEFKFDDLMFKGIGSKKNSKNPLSNKGLVENKKKKLRKKINSKLFINFLYLLEKKLLLLLLSLPLSSSLLTKKMEYKLEQKLSKILNKELARIGNLKKLSIIKSILLQYFIKVSKNYIIFIVNNLNLIQEYKSIKNKNKQVKFIFQQFDNEKLKRTKSNLLIKLLNVKFNTNIKLRKYKIKIFKKKEKKNNFLPEKVFYHIMNLYEIIIIYLNKNKNNNSLTKNKFNQFILNITNFENVTKILLKKKKKKIFWNYSLFFEKDHLNLFKSVTDKNCLNLFKVTTSKINYALVQKKKIKLSSKNDFNFSFLKEINKKELEIVQNLNKPFLFLKKKKTKDAKIKQKNKQTTFEIFINKIKKKNVVKKNLNKIQNNIKILKKKMVSKAKFVNIKNSEQFFLSSLNFLKFFYNMKYWIFNLYFYFLSKLLLQESKTLFFKFFKKFELNVFEITRKVISADIVAKYIDSSFSTNHSVYETMRPILVDLEERIKTKRVGGFKITVSGRFKRAQRATYWWKKDAHLFTGTPTKGIDYAATIHRTKYGVCTISVWLTLGLNVGNGLKQEYPFLMPFFFLLKEDKFLNIKYFLLKKNIFWLKQKGIKNNVALRRGFIHMLLYKYIYLYIFFKNIYLMDKSYINNACKFYYKRVFLPHYFVYKIFLNDILAKNYIKILPFIHLKFLKRINLRNSYKVNLLNKITNKANINIFKYKIHLY